MSHPIISLHWLPVMACKFKTLVLAYRRFSPNIKVIIKSHSVQFVCFFSPVSTNKRHKYVCLCVAQTQCPSFIPEIDSSKNSKQLRIKGTYYVSTSKVLQIVWFIIPSSYLAGHEVDRAPERAKGSHIHWGGIEKAMQTAAVLHIWGTISLSESYQEPVNSTPC